MNVLRDKEWKNAKTVESCSTKKLLKNISASYQGLTRLKENGALFAKISLLSMTLNQVALMNRTFKSSVRRPGETIYLLKSVQQMKETIENF